VKAFATRLADAMRCGLRAAFERWRAGDAPAKVKRRCSFFDLPPGTLGTSHSADEQEAEDFDRAHFRNWPGRR
jgi:hypothetical protein